MLCKPGWSQTPVAGIIHIGYHTQLGQTHSELWDILYFTATNEVVTITTSILYIKKLKHRNYVTCPRGWISNLGLSTMLSLLMDETNYLALHASEVKQSLMGKRGRTWPRDKPTPLQSYSFSQVQDQQNGF